jgi:hypothetical protein
MIRKPHFTAATLILFLAFAASAASAEDAAAPPLQPGVPRLTVLKNQRMLVVTMKGDPSKTADKAVKTLYGAFFRSATEAEKNAPLEPRVRWSFASPGTPRKDWIGEYALPVSQDFPAAVEGTARVEEWRYGLTAEILHVGPYAKETASIAILKDFIARNGYAVFGDLEEAYLQGPATFYDGKPEGYRTLIRFPVGNIQDFPKTYVPLTSLP